MKRIGIIILMIITAFGAVYAQEETTQKEDNAVKREKMFREVRDFKMKFLAQEMDLSEAQKKKFFELYDEMSESKKECYQEAVVMERKLKKDKNASDEEYQQVRNAFAQANAKWAEIEKQYDAKFSEFLSQKQIYKMKEAEENFRAKFDEMKHNRKKGHPKKSDNK